MRRVAHAGFVALLALLAVVLLAPTGTVQAAFTLAAATHLVKGSEIRVIYSDAENIALGMKWVDGSVANAPGPVLVPYPASFWPVSQGGLSDPTFNQSVSEGVGYLNDSVQSGDVIWGYSQGAVVGSLYKRDTTTPGITYVYIANPMRPNGGVLSSFEQFGTVPVLDVTFHGSSPTTSPGWAPGEPPTTFDYARQYDGWTDWPTNPLNPVAGANALMGILLIHDDYVSVGPEDAISQGQYGDTAYYLIPTYPVPLLMPVQMVPFLGTIAADTLDPVVRLVVEAGYNRAISPGQPTPANYTYFPNPLAFGGNILVAIPTGLDNGLQDIGIGRAFGTTRPDIGPGSTGQGAYGIGGPPLTPTPTTNEQNAALTQHPQISVNSQPEAVGAQGIQSPPAGHQPAPDIAPPSDKKPGPKLNLVNTPSLSKAGNRSPPSTPAATNLSEPKLRNPNAASLNKVARSIKSALSGPSKVGVDGSTGSQDGSEGAGGTSASS